MLFLLLVGFLFQFLVFEGFLFVISVPADGVCGAGDSGVDHLSSNCSSGLGVNFEACLSLFLVIFFTSLNYFLCFKVMGCL